MEQTILIRFDALKQRGIVRNRVTLARWIKTLNFPRPIQLGVNTVAWNAAEVEEWLRQRAAQSQDKVRQVGNRAGRGGKITSHAPRNIAH